MRFLTRWTFLLTATVGAFAQTQWVDPSPHGQRLVQVGSNASIEVLDWGGSGRTLVLLAQLGQTAHIYDGWAPMLATGHHVLGITRRGYGASSAGGGFSAEELAMDIVRVLDAEKVQDPVLVGNGFAGEEMSWIASRFPNRVAGLVYLNAAYDRTNIGAEGAIARRIPQRGPTPADMASVEAVTRWASNGGRLPIPEAEFRQLAQVAPDGRVTGERTPREVQQQILAGMVRADYGTIRVPVLAVYAKAASADAFPGCQAATDPVVGEACRELFAWTQQQLEASKRLIATIPSRTQVVEITGASAFVFLSNPGDVTRALEPFLASLPPWRATGGH
jgi:non-heme chloroperoxidase